ncbi:MAG: rod shape-determining protein MreC [Lachnospiraceae bacterium]|jgi:rod shape-determining protein MreC|nr:rod shape-determining protein MreC [Lachnospiraceae bacterium]
MKKKSRKNIPSRYILIGLTVVFLCAIFITYKFDISSGPVNTITGYVFVPIQKGINNIGSWLYNRTEGFKDLQTVVKENEALQEKINELTAQNSTLQLEHYEYLRLLELLNLNEKYSDYNKVAARITGKEPGNWFNTFTIDKGTNDGLKVDMNVIAGSGLVGIISDVGPNWAKVRSIIDDSSNVSAMDLNTTDLCIVAGDLKSMTSSQTILFQDMSDSDGNSAVGDQVVTSNISSKFLPGLLIGYISSIKKDGNNLTVSGEITPVVDFEHLEEVLVITKLKE